MIPMIISQLQVTKHCPLHYYLVWLWHLFHFRIKKPKLKRGEVVKPRLKFWTPDSMLYTGLLVGGWGAWITCVHSPSPGWDAVLLCGSPSPRPGDGLDQRSAAWGLQKVKGYVIALMKGVEDDFIVSCRCWINLLGEKGTVTKNRSLLWFCLVHGGR